MKNFSDVLIVVLGLFIAGTYGFADQDAASQEELSTEDVAVHWKDFEDEYEEDSGPIIADPLRVMNRGFYHFNDVFILWIISPVSEVYGFILPRFFRVRLQDCVDNLGFVRRFLNTNLQGHPGRGGVEVGRFFINSTIGLAGLWDPATKWFHINQYDEDFDQTLGVWGCGQGIYFDWPIAGPSSVRDTFAFPIDLATHPVSYYSVNQINEASLGRIDDYKDLKKMSIDPYSALKNVYVQSRRKKVLDLE